MFEVIYISPCHLQDQDFILLHELLFVLSCLFRGTVLQWTFFTRRSLNPFIPRAIAVTINLQQQINPESTVVQHSRSSSMGGPLQTVSNAMQLQDGHEQRTKKEPEVCVVCVEGPGMETEMAFSAFVHILFARIPSRGLTAGDVGNVEEY